MTFNLMADSDVYMSQAELYDRFSAVEDASGLVFSALLPEVKGKKILDIGCGTGKYLTLFSPHVSHITGVDVASGQIEVARQRTASLDNVTVIEGDAATAPLPHAQYDVIISTWAIGTILDATHRKTIVDRMQSLLAADGKIFLVENDEGGEFEDIRGRVNDPLHRTRSYNEWLVNEGFQIFHRLPAHFAFKDEKEAKDIFSAIWGKQVENKIKSALIEHKIIVLTR